MTEKAFEKLIARRRKKTEKEGNGNNYKGKKIRKLRNNNFLENSNRSFLCALATLQVPFGENPT